MGRLEKWRRPQYFKVAIAQLDKSSSPPILELIRDAPQRIVDNSPGILPTLIGTARELIFEHAEDNTKITIIGFQIDSTYLDLILSPSFSIVSLKDDNQTKHILAIALVLDVPVYPEDDESAIELARLHAELISDGLLIQSGSRQAFSLQYTGEQEAFIYNVGSTQPKTDHDGRLVYTGERAVSVLAGDINYSPTASLSPADLLIVQSGLRRYGEEVAEAARILALLRAGIDQLDKALKSNDRNEKALQKCLTTYPVLFGLEYKRVMPQHPLGADFRMDYALERHSGLIDLVEIEASTHVLYTRGKDPSAHLIHAEQQVLDWLDWIEEYSGYARKDLQGLMSPQAFVVIGRSVDLKLGDRERLQRRNVGWKGTLLILTYDDLLDRAKNIVAVLTAAK